MKSEPRRSIVVVQLGASGYRIESATNFLDVPVGKTISRYDVEQLIATKVSVTIKRNK